MARFPWETHPTVWGGSMHLYRRGGNETHSNHSKSIWDWIQYEPKNVTIPIYHGPMLFGLEFLASNILITGALLAGLILGICGLNMTLLELRAATGTHRERKQARAVAKLKKRETWMLCSLILVSVGCGESFPFLIQIMYPGSQIWVPILVSTLCIAIVGEIIPQYIIPRRAVAWGYYCRHLVWACMFATAFITWPLAWILDHVGGQRDQLELFTSEELGGIIRHHEKSERNGSSLGQDTSRIMLGALKLDGRKIGGEIAAVPESNTPEQDLEKADFVVVEGMIIKWSAVKHIRIDEPVDEALVKKVLTWSYSRLPVIGTAGKEREREESDNVEWTQNTQIFGFLHIKSLIGLEFKFPKNPETPLLVKDLPLYPLPIVREDMSVYELLNLFQSGMSRMAVIVPNDTVTCNTGAVWTVTEKANDETILKLKEGQTGQQWSTDYLAAAQAAIETGTDEKIENPGIKSPKPIGIVTFEDIIDMILQKTSRDEKDFYDRNTANPPTKVRKAGDFPVNMAALVSAHSNPECKAQQVSIKSKGPYELAKSTLRRRKVTNEKTVCAIGNTLKKAPNTRQSGPGAMDGADETSIEIHNDELQVKKTRGEIVDDSSYTQNSQGGFHAHESTGSRSTDNDNKLTPGKVAELAATVPPIYPKKFSYESSTTRSLPSRKCDSRSLSDELKQTFRHVSAAPKLPTLRRVTPFSGDTISSSGKQSGAGKGSTELIMPDPLQTAAGDSGVYYEPGFNPKGSRYNVDESVEDFFDRTIAQHATQKTCETASLDFSDDGEDREEDLRYLYDAFPVSLTRASLEISDHTHHSLGPIEEEVEKKYDGFPLELLDEDKENHTPKYISLTLPRSMGALDFDAFESIRKKTPRERETSFHDDRALLPSQQKPSMQQDEDSVSGIRRTSLWF